MVTGSQLRAGRGLLNLSVAELAEQTGLAVNTIRRAEGTNGAPPVTTANIRALTEALNAAGVLFIEADELGPGVRLRSFDALPMRPRRREKKEN